MEDYKDMLSVLGARVHNLKNIDVTIPHNKLTVITGLSGSGKSSLAFDTIFAEGQRRYVETFSAYARNMLGTLERPDVDNISGLSPVIAIEQKTVNRNPRSTIGTTTEVYDYLRLLYARIGEAYSYTVKHIEHRYASVESSIKVKAPLCDTEFRLSGDRFLEAWNMTESIVSPRYTASAVEAHTYAEQLSRYNSNE